MIFYCTKFRMMYRTFWEHHFWERELKQVIEEANAKPMEDINRYISVSSLCSQLLSFVSLGKPNFHMIFGHDSFKSTISPCIVTTSMVFASVCKVFEKEINTIKTSKNISLDWNENQLWLSLFSTKIKKEHRIYKFAQT